MYIRRRVNIIGPPVWKSTISPHLSKSELASLRPWQSEHQQCMLSPLHHHTLTPPGYPTMPSHTQNPSDIKHDTSTALVPRGAMCTAGMAMLGSALQPPRLHATHLQMQYFGQFLH